MSTKSWANLAQTSSEIEVPVPHFTSKLTRLVESIRSLDTAFYKDVMKAMSLYHCERDSRKAGNMARCVDVSVAFKDSNNSCVKPSDSNCDHTTTCERDSNCYWLKPEEGKPRERRYTDEESEKNSDFLFSISASGTYGGTGEERLKEALSALLYLPPLCQFIPLNHYPLPPTQSQSTPSTDLL
jgi:hypothetical protein